MGQEESGIDQLARVGFATLGLQTFLTAGPKESRAWTIKVGATAPQAAGVIHTDFERGFIKAEVVSFDDLVDAGSMAEAQGARQGAHRGQGLRHAGRRRGGVPLQRLTRALRTPRPRGVTLIKTPDARLAACSDRVDQETGTALPPGERLRPRGRTR